VLRAPPRRLSYHTGMSGELITLGVETSCDETAVAVVRGRFEALASLVASQNDIHAKYGGIVPELACRRHVETIRPLTKEALDRAGVTLGDVGLVAVTRGPGLVGALLVGLSYAKALAWARGLPLAGVNHLTGHIMAAFAHRPDTPLPAVALLVSGGHTELFFVRATYDIVHLGGTRDDAAGEAFDKVAKMLGLGYPGGPEIERRAKEGEARFDIPVALADSGELDFSFSGPKTAVKNLLGKIEPERRAGAVNDLCASFQQAAVDALALKTRLAVGRHRPASVLVVGGVACNGALRAAMEKLGEDRGIEVVIPPPALCTDNALMIAVAGANAYLDNPGGPLWRDYLRMDANPSWIPGLARG